jgi:uroporphyrinogen-III decarboxylase
MSYFLREPVDFGRHNAAVRALHGAYAVRRQERVPVVHTWNPRLVLSNPALNPNGYRFTDYFTDAETHVECQLAFQHYVRHHMLGDHEMGVPEGGWALVVDFQNVWDQGWFGCPIRFGDDGFTVDTTEVLRERPMTLYQWPDPDPLWGQGDFMRRAVEMFEQLEAIALSGREYLGRPLLPPTRLPGINTDGPFSVAVKLRGATELMYDMHDDPEYAHSLLAFVTGGILARMRAVKDWLWDRARVPPQGRDYRENLWFADDSIAMLSPAQYREYVLPHHRQIFQMFDRGEGCTIHLCGRASHLFPLLANEFRVRSFDTGFPVDHGALRRALGPDIEIHGGPTVMTVKDGTPAEIADEVRRVCASGIMEGRRFILSAANNLAPGTPAENVRAFYEAAKAFGRYDG